MTATAKLNKKAYATLLAENLPVVISDDGEYRRMRLAIRRLMDKHELSREETVLLQLIGLLVQHYEATQYPLESTEPHDVLRELMAARGVRQADLAAIFKSDGYVSDVVKGKRAISKANARALGEFFGVSPALFI